MLFVFLPDALHNVEGLAQKLLLPIHEVKWYLDYHRQILDKPKQKKKRGGDCSGVLTSNVMIFFLNNRTKGNAKYHTCVFAY